MNWNNYGQCEGQISLFDLDPTYGFGKTYQEPCQVQEKTKRARTSDVSLKKSQGSSRLMFLSLYRGGASGQTPDAWTVTDGLSHGVSETQLTRECHREEEESFLWQILEETVQEKYFLSEKACRGILRRSEKRGKTLPKVLKNALMKQGNISEQGLADLVAE